MEVYLVPVGAERYELYSETSHEGIRPGAEVPATGFWRRQVQRFHVVLDRVEREHHRRPAPFEPGAGRLRRAVTRIRHGVIRWMAEKVAEQRLLWQLRGKARALAFVPADVDSHGALARIRGMLQGEARRHGGWLIFNGIALILSAILAPIPGPNLIAYYFAFRAVGHYLARAGALSGASRVRWEVRPSAELVELRQAIALDPVARDSVVHRVAARLRLQHFASFFERIVLPTT